MILGCPLGFTAKCDHENLYLYLSNASKEKIEQALDGFVKLAFSLYNEKAFLSKENSFDLFPKVVGNKLVFELCLYGIVEHFYSPIGIKVKYQPLLLETDITVSEETSYSEEIEGEWVTSTHIAEVL